MTVTHSLVQSSNSIYSYILPTHNGKRKKDCYTGVCCLPNLAANCPPTVLFFVPYAQAAVGVIKLNDRPN